MQATATGTFQVTMTPRPAGDGPAPPGLGRFVLAKTFEGGLSGRSQGEMLSAGDPATGSAGYVALEMVEGALDGRSGRFALQHSGTMHAGAQALAITVVPGSGGGELAGISGRLELAIVAGVHHYTLHYELPG